MAAAPPVDDELPILSGAALWGIGLLLSLANFVAVLDMTIVNVAVPTIAGSLGASITQGAWVITSYAVAEAITVPLTGWLAGRFGSARLFAIALVAFALASLACGLSASIGALVAWRVVQGVFGAPLMPLSQALLMRLFPQRLQPAAMGIWGVTTVTAPIFGPIVGGVLCDSYGWPAAFLVNVPIAVLGGLIAWRVLVGARRPAATRAPFDAVGLVLLVGWVGLLQVILDIGKDHDWFESRLVVGLAVGSAICFWMFLVWELTADHPIVDLRVLRHRGFTAAVAAFGCGAAACFSINVLTPLWLQLDLGYTATQAGYVMSAAGVLAVFVAPLVAWLCGRVDPRAVAFAGMAWVVLVTLLRSLANNEMGFPQIFAQLLLLGLALPTFFLPLTLLSMAPIAPGEMANASGLSAFARTVSTAFATSIVTTRWEQYATAYHADLVGRSPNLQLELDRVAASGFSIDQALGVVDRIVQREALVLAANRVFLEMTVVLLLGLVLIWVIPKPVRPERELAAAKAGQGGSPVHSQCQGS
jgi:DHA2 family multidrug resistance protein